MKQLAMIPLICFDICKKTVLLMVSRYFPNNVPILLEQSFQWLKIFSEQCPSPPGTIVSVVQDIFRTMSQSS